MNRVVAMTAAGVVVAAGGLALGPAFGAVADTATTTSIVSTSMAGGGSTGEPLAQGVVGMVSPGPQGERVVVKYFKKANGSWNLRATHKPKIKADGIFETTFTPVPKRGTCKVTAKYRGDATHKGSHTAKTVDCATGTPK